MTDDKIGAEYHKLMNKFAYLLDAAFNGDTKPRKICFVLLLAPFETSEGRVNYISNGNRQDCVTLLKEVLARFEGQPEMKGRA